MGSMCLGDSSDGFDDYPGLEGLRITDCRPCGGAIATLRIQIVPGGSKYWLETVQPLSEATYRNATVGDANLTQQGCQQKTSELRKKSTPGACRPRPGWDRARTPCDAAAGSPAWWNHSFGPCTRIGRR